MKRDAFVQDRGHAEWKVGSGRNERANGCFGFPGGGWDAVAGEGEAVINPKPKMVALSRHLPESNATLVTSRERLMQDRTADEVAAERAIFQHRPFSQAQQPHGISASGRGDDVGGEPGRRSGANDARKP